MSLQKLLKKARKPSPFLLVLSAPSGGGKTTVCNRLLERQPWLKRAVTATTRKPRAGEQDGRDYWFLTQAEFRRRVAEGGFFEYAQVHGNYYGTPRKEVEASLRKGQSLVLVIDVQGGAAVKGRRPDSLMVFLVPPSMGELKRRLFTRGTDEPEAMRRRLREAARECDAGLGYEYLIINDDLDETVEALAQVCLGARHRRAVQ
ncbi:MAG TPA: guanylate kinase [bacterium]|jgi:guanylate kinase|nr:guanylate kinase [bacterium]